MTESYASEIVAAEGHLIDSQILNAIFDAVVRRGGSFEVLHFEIGRTNDEVSRLTMKVTAPSGAAALGQLVEELVPLGCHVAAERDARLEVTERDRCAPESFYSTTNHRTFVRHGGRWLEVAHQRMDTVIVVEDGRATCRKLRDLRAGDPVVCGVDGVRVVPAFRERDRFGFAFMINDVSSERRVEVLVAKIAEMMRHVKGAGGRIAVVAGPVVVYTGGADYFCEIIRAGYVDVLLAGNALAVHDVEHALFGTSLGIDLAAGTPVEGGHRHHMRAINAINRAGGLTAAVEQGVLARGIMYECVKRGVPFVLAGSIRDVGRCRRR